jgi:hypothetical protein
MCDAVTLSIRITIKCTFPLSTLEQTNTVRHTLPCYPPQESVLDKVVRLNGHSNISEPFQYSTLLIVGKPIRCVASR